MHTPKKENINTISIANMSTGSLVAFSLVILIFVSLVTYLLGYSNAFKDLTTELGVTSNPDNIGGLAYEYGETAECIVYTDEVLISKESCTSHLDCTPNGICLFDIEKCAYFVN
jgi:hypothetical protein